MVDEEPVAILLDPLAHLFCLLAVTTPVFVFLHKDAAAYAPTWGGRAKAARTRKRHVAPISH